MTMSSCLILHPFLYTSTAHLFLQLLFRRGKFYGFEFSMYGASYTWSQMMIRPSKENSNATVTLTTTTNDAAEKRHCWSQNQNIKLSAQLCH